MSADQIAEIRPAIREAIEGGNTLQFMDPPQQPADVARQVMLTLEPVLGPGYLIRYNNVRSVSIQGEAVQGYSSGQAIAAMEEISAVTLPSGYGYAWTGTALRSRAQAPSDRY